MDLEITGRGTKITAELRSQAEAGLARVEKIIGPKSSAKVVLSEEKNRVFAEVIVHSALHDLTSQCEGRQLDVVLKDCLDKVEAQAVSHKKRIVTTRHHPEQSAAGSVRLQGAEQVDADTDEERRLA